jgi:hypothetical protein
MSNRPNWFRFVVTIFALSFAFFTSLALFVDAQDVVHAPGF